jgi:hypothetical protein
MKIKCAPVCQSCDYMSVETRCPLDPNAVDALYPGDITKMFNRILTEPSIQEFEPKIVSRPDYAEGDTPETADYIIGPWMVVFENAITDEEADRLIELGGLEGYERSADVGRKLADGTYEKKVRLQYCLSCIEAEAPASNSPVHLPYDSLGILWSNQHQRLVPKRMLRGPRCETSHGARRIYHGGARTQQ